MKIAAGVLALAALVTAAGCGLVTGPDALVDEFFWEQVENPDDVQEGVEVAAFFGDVSFLGQMKTPTLCYSLKSSLDRSGSTLTLRIDATNSNSPNCAQAQGGFRYNGIIRNLDAGSYTLRVIHAITGQPPVEYTKEFTL